MCGMKLKYQHVLSYNLKNVWKFGFFSGIFDGKSKFNEFRMLWNDVLGQMKQIVVENPENTGFMDFSALFKL